MIRAGGPPRPRPRMDSAPLPLLKPLPPVRSQSALSDPLGHFLDLPPLFPYNVPMLPQALLSKLSSEEDSLSLLLSSSPPSSLVPSYKDLSDRTLLSLTPKALSILDETMDSGLPKDRLASALAVLDRSPATKPSLSLSSEPSIPLEALRSLLSGLSALMGSPSSPSPPPDPLPAPDQSVTYSEVPSA